MSKVRSSQLESWRKNWRERSPDPMGRAAAKRAPEVASASFTTAPHGYAIRFATKNWLGRQLPDVDLFLNPLAALTIAKTILRHGKEAGWLDENDELNMATKPPRLMH